MTDWLIELPSCPSTNTWAREHFERLTHGSVVYTQRQTAGRGRGSRQWQAPPGVLTATIVVDTNPVAAGGPLSLAAGLAVAHAVEDYAPHAEIGLKWPNDVYCRDRKLAGILCEGRSHAGRHRLAVGIGLNLTVDWAAAGLTTADFPDLAELPIALHALGPVPAPLVMLTSLRSYLLQAAAMLEHDGWPALLAQIRARDWLLGRPLLAIGDHGGRLDGTAAGIDDDGSLLVARPDGGLTPVDSGHIHLQ